jgi:nicotinate-nucleotide--dimethylbenzimidazole phosphoribosyltransferase
MTEILTESFCERCGTRYTFETAAPRKSRIERVKVVSKGLRNYVLQDESTLSEAMADARSEEERAATSHQLDAFHKTFNFCMTCRQYTCGNCWNDVESRCLTCSPLPGTEASPVVTETLDIAGTDVRQAPPILVVGETDHPVTVEGWPEADLSPDRLSRAMGEPDAAVDASPEPTALGLAPGQTLEDAVAAYEAQLAAAEAAEAVAAAAEPEPDRVMAAEPGPAPAAAAEPEPVVEAEPAVAEPEPVAAAEPEPVAAAEPERAVVEPEPEPEPVVAAAEPVVAAQPEPEPVVAAGDDIIEQPTWPVAPPPDAATTPAPARQPEPQAPAANPWLTVAPDDGSAEPQWPIAPTWARTARADAPTTLAGRQLLPRDDVAALWAASAREVLSGGPGGPISPVAAPAPATPQPCVQCGLSLSANARFCRRCGARQG